ncbi:hypothetical protein F5Y10DRAFT_284664 [Nemania abortiva]|nr:hypothetical protein F5Y10DRAFT_284664 [Nemania abortiva]
MSQLGPGRERLRIAALGFSILFDPVDATTDLVFVHGLQGHPERTWTYAPGNSHVKKRRPFFRRKDKEEVPSSSEAPVYWPYDLLAKHPDLSKTRIMAYGYDSLVTKFFDANNKQNISEHGNDLMVALEQERKSDAASIRPLIFVAHSLGGILVKVALDNSSRAPQQKFQRLFESTRGVVFLGTPHGGSDVAGLATTVSNLAKLALQDSNQRVLKGLSPGNEMLRHYGKVFLQLIHRGNFGVHTFYETKAMTGVYGITGMVVPRESARIGDVLHEVERGLNANHHEICKFSGPEDEKYRAVSGAIVDYIKDAAKLPVAPALPRPLSPALSTVDSEMTLTQREKSNRKEQEVGQGQTLLVPPMYGASYGKRISPQAEIGLRHDNPGLFLNDLDNALDDYLYALKISESHWEEKEYSTPLPPIDGAQDNSDWFFDSPEFREWESNDSISLLWLGGKSSQENTRVVGCLLQRTLESKASLFHYTHNPAARNEKLSPGAEILETVRELIRQIVEEECDRMLFAMNHYPRSKLTKSAPYSVSTQDWELRHLMTVLVYCLVAVPHQPTYLLVDGFNLSDANVNRFLGQLVRLLDDGREDHTNVILKVLFTSGPRSVPRPLSESDKRLASIPYIDKDKELQDCLQSLYSTNFDARPGTILDADDFTFDWLWEDDTFRHWQTAEKSSLLLIQGKAGSGKSTLAKRILKGIPRPTPSLREDDTENTDISEEHLQGANDHTTSQVRTCETAGQTAHPTSSCSRGEEPGGHQPHG